MINFLLQYLPFLLEGVWMTIKVSLASLVASIILGLFIVFLTFFLSYPFRVLLGVYVWITRALPELLLMLFVFYGGQIIINASIDYMVWDFYIEVNAFIAGVITLSLIYSAYMSETFRGAILAIRKGQIEAAYAFGFTKRQVFIYIMLPQMLRYSLGGVANIWQVLLKTSAIVSVIGLDELVRKSATLANSTHLPFAFYTIALILYLILTQLSDRLLSWINDKYQLSN